MADTIVRLVMETKGVKEGAKEFQNFEHTSTRAMSSAESAVAKSLASMAAQYLSLGVAISKSMKAMSSGVEFNKFVETQTMSFTVMMKSAEKAKAQMKDLYDFAVDSPLTFRETASSAKQLMAYGFTAKDLIPTMDRLGSVALATGHSLGDIAYVYGTLRSQGRAYSRDLMQFGMRGIPIYEELAVVMGTTADQIQKMASQGKIGFKEVEQAFINMTTGAGRFAGTIPGYMETLTGTISMLGDILEKTLGSLMSSTTDTVKRIVANITSTIEGGGFQQFIKDLGSDIGNIAGFLGDTLVVLLKMAPVITTILKLWVTANILSAMVKIPILLVQMSNTLLTIAGTMTTMNVAGWGAGLAGSIGYAVTAVKTLGTALAGLIAANPWLLAIAGITAAATIAFKATEAIARNNKTSSDVGTRRSQLEKDFYNIDTTGMMVSGTAGKRMLEAGEIAKIAEEYKLTEGDTANILRNVGAISDEQYKVFQNAKSTEGSMAGLAARLKGIATNMSSMKIQSDFLSGLTGKDASSYFDTDGIAKGGKGADEYIKGFADRMQQQKDIFREAFTPDMEKSLLEDEAKSLAEALAAGFSVEKLFDKTSFDEKLIARLRVLQEELKKTGSGMKPPADMGTWWEPLIQAAKMTNTQVDDLTVSYAKQAEAVDKEASARKENLFTQMALTSNADEQAILQMRIAGIEALRVLYQKDLTNEMEKQIELAKIQEEAAKFDKMIGGDPEYFDKLKGDIFNAREAGKNGGATFFGTMGMLGDTAKLATQGTEVGSMLSGGDPVMMLIMSLAEAAASIENVSKLLNPIGTFLDAMFSVLEPFINSALKPFVSWIEMLGEVVAKILAPFFSIQQILNSLWYAMRFSLLMPLQLLGAAFVWLNDQVIAPFGNKIIDSINSVIRVMNKIPGVSIRYLDNINLLSNATASLADRMNLAKDSLSASIDYLSDKINSVADKELDTLQELYEVGAITGAEYEQRQKALTRVESDNLNVPDAYKNLTDVGEMLKSLTLLAEGQLEIANLGDKATPESIKAILDELGIVYNEKSQEQLFKDAMLTALEEYDASNNSTINTLSNGGAMSSALSEALIDSQIAQIKKATAYKTYETKGGGVDKKGHWKTNWFPKFGTIAEGKWVNTTYLPTYTEEVAHTFQEALDAYSAASTQASKDDWAKILIDTAKANTTLTEEQIRNALGIPLNSSSSKNILSPVGKYVPSSKNQGSGQSTIVNVTVNGSVQTEKDLANTISKIIYTQRSLGVLTV